MLFRPNTTCELQRRGTTPDVYNKYTFAPATTVPCAVIYFNLSRQKSSVRADSSGSRGRAQNFQGDAKFLFPASTQLTNGDIVTKDGFTLRVTEIFPRHAVDGRVDHLEVDFEKAEPV